jgi:hypothetical protein
MPIKRHFLFKKLMSYFFISAMMGNTSQPDQKINVSSFGGRITSQII